MRLFICYELPYRCRLRPPAPSAARLVSIMVPTWAGPCRAFIGSQVSKHVDAGCCRTSRSPLWRRRVLAGTGPSPDSIALLERARAEIHGLTMSELCEAKGWHRPWFYKRTDAAAKRVAAYLNEQAGELRPDVDAVQYENRIRSLK